MEVASLPRSFLFGGVRFAIRWDFRAVLDIFEAMNDPELPDDVRAYEALHIFYPDADGIPPDCWQEARDKLLWFLRGGADADDTKPDRKLIDWKQDFPLIVPPVNRVLGYDIRNRRRVHWWTVLGAFYEIGDCLFSQVVHIRSMKQKGKPLDKSDREFYQENRNLIDFKITRTSAEEALLAAWTGGKEVTGHG